MPDLLHGLPPSDVTAYVCLCNEHKAAYDHDPGGFVATNFR